MFVIRILRFSHSAGVPAYRERERELLRKFDVKIKLVIPKLWDHLGASKLDVISEPFDVETIATYGTGSVPLFAFDPVAAARIISEFKPDIVDVHEEPYAVSGFELVSMTRVLAPNSACVFYSAQNIFKRYPPPFAWSEKFVYGVADGAYPCSLGVADVLRKKGYNTNIATIPLGVDPKIFCPGPSERKKYGLDEDAFVVGYFGRIEGYKGTTLLVEALTQLPSNVHVMMVGAGPQLNDLKQKSVESNLQHRLHFFGPVNSSDVPSMLRLCDLVAIPSLTTKTWKEQFGRAVTEALACGVPVVASDSGSLPEVVGSAGLVVPENDVESLVAAIKRFSEDSDFRLSSKDSGLKMVEAKYTWSRVADQMHHFYEEAISVRRQRARRGLGSRLGN